MSDFRSAFHLVDIFRKLHPRARESSWFNFDFCIGSRLDKFFISSNFVRFAQSCEIYLVVSLIMTLLICILF